MKIIEPKVVIITEIDGKAILQKIEEIGRVCYKSEHKISKYSSNDFVAAIVKRGHESVIEHEIISVKVICDRGVSHEIVRHRLASYSQESTRYCNYSQEKFGKELTMIKPFFLPGDSGIYKCWERQMVEIEKTYNEMIACGAKPEEARSILPCSLKTEIVITMNLRAWRHFFKLRCAKASHPQLRQITIPLLLELQKRINVIFDDLDYDRDFDPNYYAEIEG